MYGATYQGVLRIVLTDFHKYDAVGNFVRGIADWAASRALPCAVYAERHSPGLAVQGDFAAFYREMTHRDVLLYHLPHEDPALPRLLTVPGRRVVYYHNITPGHFFRPYEQKLADMLDRGRASLPLLAKADAVFANSAWSLADVLPRLRPGASCGVMPPLTPAMLKRLQALSAPPPDRTRPYLLSVGRVVPHKNIAWALRLFGEFHRRMPDWEYVILGGDSGMPGYEAELHAILAKLGPAAARVHFTGQLPDSEAAALFQNAAASLCGSRHEGFGVPLVEAMAYGVPVIALDQPAVRETLGGAGLLLTGEDLEAQAGRIVDLVSNHDTLALLKKRQYRRLDEIKTLTDENAFWEGINPRQSPHNTEAS